MRCDYADGVVTENSVFSACVASFTFDDTSIGEDDIVWLFDHVGDECEESEETTVGSEVGVLDRVIDGDTLDLFICPNGMCSLAPLEPERIRFWHISAGETGYDSGEAATAWLESILTTGHELSFDRKGEDPYGRILAVVYGPDGTNLNEKMVELGLAHPWSAEESEEFEVEITPTGDAVIIFTGTFEVPDAFELGNENWVSAELKNTGDKFGTYWLGIRLVDEVGTEWRYTGNSDYASSIGPGETKVLWVSFTPPTTLVGALRPFIVLNRLD